MAQKALDSPKEGDEFEFDAGTQSTGAQQPSKHAGDYLFKNDVTREKHQALLPKREGVTPNPKSNPPQQTYPIKTQSSITCNLLSNQK